MNCNIEILSITWSKYRDKCFKLAIFYDICLFYDNVVTFYTYDILDVSRVTVWLIGLNKYNDDDDDDDNNNNNHVAIFRDAK
jgi:hypothetical protein